jgi:hypothetical protein
MQVIDICSVAHQAAGFRIRFESEHSREPVREGDLGQPRALGVGYRSDMRRNGEDHHYGVDYSGDGTVTNVSAAPSTKRPLLVAAERIRGTVDQLTAYFWVERQLAEHGTCRVIVPVFDGSGLYTLRFTDVKREILSADGYQNFASLVTRRWSKPDSNSRSHLRRYRCKARE